MSPSVCFASLLLGCTLLPSPAIAEHEGTAAWMQGIDKTRKEIVSKIRNERIEHKWLEDGKTFFARIKKVEKSNQWFAYDLSTGDKTTLEKATEGKPSLEKFPTKSQPAHRDAKSPDKKWTASIKDGLILLTPKEGEPVSSGNRLEPGIFWEKNFLWAPDSSAVVVMLTVGEVDTNVDPSSTYQVVNALIKADKDFEYYMVPNGGHGIGEKPHLRRKRIEFFQKHLQSAK